MTGKPSNDILSYVISFLFALAKYGSDVISSCKFQESPVAEEGKARWMTLKDMYEINSF